MNMAEQSSRRIPPYSEELSTRVKEVAQKKIEQWSCLVGTLGLPESDIELYKNVVVESVETLFNDMIEEIQETQNRLIEEIEQLLQTSQKLCTQLSIKLPEYGENQLSLYQERDLLRANVAEYETIYKTRHKEVERLQNRERALCKTLGRTIQGIPTSPLPSQETISSFESYLEELERERFERMEKFCEKKSEILRLIEELGVQPYLNFQKLVVEKDDSEFLVTDENMVLLEEYYTSLERKLAENEEEIENVGKKIERLWNILEVDIHDRNVFRENCKGNSIQKLSILKEELRRCEHLKKKNIETFIEKIRTELTLMWDKIHYTQEQRDEFQFFNTSIFTEDLLEIHERELQKVKTYYQEHSEIFVLLEKHKDLCQKMNELEMGQEQPDRYKNRGGQLLKEEKERNKFSKRIPLVEEKLSRLALQYFSNTGKLFLTWGETVEQYINRLRETQKEERMVRMSAKKQQREQMTLTPGKSRLFSAASSTRTPNTASKFRGNTPIQSSTKKSRLAIFKENKGLQSAPPQTQKVSYTTGGKIRTSLERARKLKQAKKRLSGLVEKSAYCLFESDLENKDPDNRSTRFFKPSDNEVLARPLDILQVRNPPIKLTTPKGTTFNMKI